MTIVAAADGSALGNPGPNGWAWYIDDSRWAAGGSPHGTNNQGELQAVLELLRATAHTDEALRIECDSRYVIDSVTKWMPGWKRKGWRKSDGGPVLNRDLLEGIDEAMRGRKVEFTWVKGHAGHPLNEAADERANAAARAYQAGKEPDCGPGFDANASSALADGPAAIGREPALSAQQEALWADADDLLAGLEDYDEPAAIEVRVLLTAGEHARLAHRAAEQGVSIEDALRGLI